MTCSLTDLQNKEVVNVIDGTRLGFVDDIQMDTEKSSIIALVIYGRSRLLGFLGKDNDIVIKCDEIELVGEDIILVSIGSKPNYTNTKRFSVESLLK